jgi:hypothetical protein
LRDHEVLLCRYEITAHEGGLTFREVLLDIGGKPAGSETEGNSHE